MGATMHDVARVAGVSIKTVSNVINEYPHVRPGTRDKVMQAIEELDYRPNLSARGLRLGRTGIIGLAVPALRENYFAELADSVIREAEKRGLGVVIEQTSGDRETELLTFSGGRLRFVDGLIFSPVSLGQADVDVLDVGFPLVLLGERIFGGPTDHVTMVNVDAARAATEHLIRSGRKRIAVVGAHDGEVIGSAGLRLRGYREALEAAGIPFDPTLIAYTTLWHRSNGATSMRQLLATGVKFDAVFALNDTLALGAMRVLQEAGLTIPTDVAVIGFDDLDEARYSLPTLSTIDPGRNEIATTAVRVLLDRIAGVEPTAPMTEYLAEFHLVERESTGARRTSIETIR